MRERSYGRNQQFHTKQKNRVRQKGLYNKHSEKIVGIHTNTKTRCSCEACGNTRKHYGESIQEKRDSTKYIEME